MCLPMPPSWPEVSKPTFTEMPPCALGFLHSPGNWSPGTPELGTGGTLACSFPLRIQ